MSDFTPSAGPPTHPTPESVPTASPVNSSATDRIGPDSSPGGSGGSKVWILALVAMAVAGIAAVSIGGSSDDGSQLESSAATTTTQVDEPTNGGSADDEPPVSELPSTEAPTTGVPVEQDETGAEATDPQTAVVLIDGTILDQMPGVSGPTSPDVDSAIGQVAPSLTGVDFDGEPVTIGNDGRPKAIYFLAHWCPHCQVELPTIQSLIDAGEQPEGIDVYAVSTSVAADRGNFPPQAWFETEGWTSPVLLDDDRSSAVINFGAGGFPYAVFLDGDHRVLTRTAGEMPAELTLQIWEAVAGS